MRHFTLRLSIALFTFLFGVAVASVWFIKHRSSTPPEKRIISCIPAFDHNLAVKHRKEDEDPKVFAAFKELPLGALPACVDESYRLMWFPTFHSPVVVRVWRSGNKYHVASKQLSGRGGYELGDLDLEQTRPLSESEWLEFMNRLSQASFWELPSTVSEPLINDGAVWIVEGVKAGEYHWVRRRLPSGQYTDICKHLIKLSGLKTEHDLYLP